MTNNHREHTLTFRFTFKAKNANAIQSYYVIGQYGLGPKKLFITTESDKEIAPLVKEIIQATDEEHLRESLKAQHGELIEFTPY